MSLESSILGVGGIGESIVELRLLGSKFMGWEKMRVHYRKWVSLEVYIHGVEIMEETFVQRGSLFKGILALGILRETIIGRGNVFESLHHRGGMMSKWGLG